MVVKDKIVLEIVDLVKWVAAAEDDDALSELLTARPDALDNQRGFCYVFH